MKKKNLIFIGTLLLFFSLVTFLLSINISAFEDDTIEFMRFAYQLSLIIGLLFVIPWENFGLIFIDAKEFMPNNTFPQLIKKLRLRALLFKNLSVLILCTSIITIGVAVYYVIDYQTVDSNNIKVNWDFTTIKIGATFLLIFLIHILFRVFRYIIRLAGFYDGVADSLEIYQMEKEKHGIDKLVEVLIPIKYDIRELKQSSVSELLKNVIK